MTPTNFIFLLAIVTLVSFLIFGILQFVKIRSAKRSGDAEKLEREIDERARIRREAEAKS